VHQRDSNNAAVRRIAGTLVAGSIAKVAFRRWLGGADQWVPIRGTERREAGADHVARRTRAERELALEDFNAENSFVVASFELLFIRMWTFTATGAGIL
jgi:hypothetical protein